ncbi:MAG: porin [Rhodospirillaceae bacterium]|nr:porin [Rhodospirillaceae bacterium]
MRKVLLGTTAMAAAALTAGAAEAQWDVSVGGFHNQWFGYGSNNTDQRLQSFDQWSNSEIIFNGRNTLDNGITFGFQVQLEANTGGDQIDESFMFIQSAELGRIQLGSENSAGYQMQIAAPNVGLAINSGSQTQHVANPTGGALFRSAFGSTYLEPAGDNDGQKITYYTPRWEGFQFGVSYLPDVDPTGGDVNGLKTDDAIGVYNNGVSLGLNYVNSFGPVDVGLAGGFFWAEGPNGTFDFTDTYGPTTGITRSLGEDFWAWSVGADLSWAGFTIGGSYAKIEEGRLTAVNAVGSAAAAASGVGVSSTEGEGWDVGISYEQGPWGFSVTYFQGIEKGVLNAPDNRFHQSVVGNVSYTLAPGVRLVGAVGASEFAAEDDTVRAGGATTTVFPGAAVERGNRGIDDNGGVFVTGGVLLSF